MTYRRSGLTWTAFGALFAFGYVNAVLGPALPYIRAAEHISYLVGAAHQVGFAVGTGLAGLVSRRHAIDLDRRAVIAGGLSGAALASLGLGYGSIPEITVPCALLMGFLATLALIRLWATLADEHGRSRAVAMSEGEVAVSLAGIITPLVIGALAASTLSWRFALLVGLATVGVAVARVARVKFPGAAHADPAPVRHRGLPPTLILVTAVVALEFGLSFWLASYLNGPVGVARAGAAALVSVLYASNLGGRLLVSRFARNHPASRVLSAGLACVVCGLPVLLAASGTGVAVAGVALTGVGIGALFPLASALHVQARGGRSDGSLAEILSVAAIGQMAGPLLVAAVAQAAGLRAGLIAVLPAMTLAAAAALIAQGHAGR